MGRAGGFPAFVAAVENPTEVWCCSLHRPFPRGGPSRSKLSAPGGPKKNPSGLILPVVAPTIGVFRAFAGIAADDIDPSMLSGLPLSLSGLTGRTASSCFCPNRDPLFLLPCGR